MIEIKLENEILKRHRNFILGDNKNDPNRLYSKLKQALDSEKNIKIKKILNYIFNHIGNIVIGNLQNLEVVINKFENMLKVLTQAECSQLYSHLEIFLKEYTYFYSSPNWNAYIFQQSLGITVCPYCATQFIFIYESDSGRTRGTLDHFFDKASYPFLSLSIYNLVPCCKVCNSDFKGRKKVGLNTHFSPYERDIMKYLRFKRDIIPSKKDKISTQIIEYISENEDDIDFVSVFLGASNDFNLKLDDSSAPDDISTKIEGNLQLFHLEEIYNTFHKPYIQELIQRASIYNYAYRKQLVSAYGMFFQNTEELKESLIPSISNDKKLILAKLTREIIEDEIKSLNI